MAWQPAFLDPFLFRRMVVPLASVFFVFVGPCSFFRDLSPFIFLASVHFFIGLSCAVGFMTFLSFFLTLDHFFHPTFMSCLFYDFSFKIYININGVSPVFLIYIKNNIFLFIYCWCNLTRIKLIIIKICISRCSN